jgi:hypothetical protein
MSTRKRATTFLLGAGASVDAGAPDAVRLTSSFLNEALHLGSDPDNTWAEDGWTLAGELLSQWSDLPIEDLVEILRRVAADEAPHTRLEPLLPAGLRRHKTGASILIRELYHRLERLIPVGEATDRAYLAQLARFARKSGLDIFTLNYDLILELALRDQEVPFTTGFLRKLAFVPIGYERRGYVGRPWHPREFGRHVIRIHKLHGSFGWLITKGASPTCLDENAFEDREQADDSWLTRATDIGGSKQASFDEKAAAVAEQSRTIVGDFFRELAARGPVELFRPRPTHLIFGVREKLMPHPPFSVLWQRFLRALATVDTAVVIGYSFGDSHVNELLCYVQAQRVFKRRPLKIIYVAPGALPRLPHAGGWALRVEHCRATAKAALEQGLIDDLVRL